MEKYVMVEATSYRANWYNNVESRTAGKMPVYNAGRSSDPLVTAQLASSGASEKTEQAESNSFITALKNFIDIINPLQHIPIVGSAYRFMTGDDIGPVAKVAGDTLYGGPINGAVSLAQVAYEGATGKDIGNAVISALVGGNSEEKKILQPVAQLVAKKDQADNKFSDIIWSDSEVTAKSVTEIADIKEPKQNNKIQDEAIALKMMNALDKYKALKIAQYSQNSQITSGLY